MKNTINKDIKKYCSEVKKLLACSSSIKLAFISELKTGIYEYIEEHPNEKITINDIENRFGTPENIALSFASNPVISIYPPIFQNTAACLLFL